MKKQEADTKQYSSISTAFPECPSISTTELYKQRDQDLSSLSLFETAHLDNLALQYSQLKQTFINIIHNDTVTNEKMMGEKYRALSKMTKDREDFAIQMLKRRLEIEEAHVGRFRQIYHDVTTACWKKDFIASSLNRSKYLEVQEESLYGVSPTDNDGDDDDDVDDNTEFTYDESRAKHSSHPYTCETLWEDEKEDLYEENLEDEDFVQAVEMAMKEKEEEQVEYDSEFVKQAEWVMSQHEDKLKWKEARSESQRRKYDKDVMEQGCLSF